MGLEPTSEWMFMDDSWRINGYTIWLFNSLPWKITMLLSSVSHLFQWAIYTMAMLVITRGELR